MKNSSSLPSAVLLAGLALVIPSFAQDAPNPPDEGVVEVQAQAQAVPADEAKPEAKSYLGLGASAVPGFLGKHLNLPADTGVMVRSLDPDGPAAKAGFAVDDVITKIDGKAVASHREMVDHFLGQKPGEDVAIDFIHEGKPGNRSVKLGERPVGQPAAAAAGAGPEIRVLEGQLNLGGINGLPGNLPPEVDKQMRKAMDDAIKNGGANRMGIRIVPGGNGGVQIVPGGKGGNFGMASSIRMMEPDGGSIELKNADGGSEVRVIDKNGKEIWSGPWDTKQDKAAAPPDIRKRLEKLNILQGMDRGHNAPAPMLEEEEEAPAEEPAKPEAEPQP